MLILTIDLALLLFSKSDYGRSDLFKFFLNPTSWSSMPLYSWISSVALLVGAATLIIGTLLYRSDFTVFAGIVGTLLTFGASLFSLFTFIQSQAIFQDTCLGSVCSTFGTTNPLGQLIAAIIVGPLTVWYIFVTLSYWRGSDN